MWSNYGDLSLATKRQCLHSTLRITSRISLFYINVYFNFWKQIARVHRPYTHSHNYMIQQANTYRLDHKILQNQAVVVESLESDLDRKYKKIEGNVRVVKIHRMVFGLLAVLRRFKGLYFRGFKDLLIERKAEILGEIKTIMTENVLTYTYIYIYIYIVRTT